MENQTDTDSLKFRHHLIQEEFRSILTSSEYKVPVDTQGVITLSAPSLKDETGKVIDEVSPENRERIAFSVEVIKQIVAQKLRKSVEDVTREDILSYSPPLILNGETEQLPTMRQIAHELEFPEEKIELVDCGKRGVASTRTQFKVMNDDPRYKNVNHLTFVTSDYHVPRVIRTADANLRSEIHFDVLPVPHDRVPYNVFKVVRGEVNKIETYSANGDITRTPLKR